ncbi:MAG: HEPN domain-containing protein [Deltaproteobacteria bacterium]
MEVVRQWVAKADNDLKNAVHTLLMGEDCPLDTVCFHAEQCAEKYLKALLAFQGIDFPKTHDLGELVALLPDKDRFPLSVDDCERLTDYAIVTRYPGDWGTIDRQDAEQAVTLAKQVRDAIRGLLPREVFE